jgi:ribosomal protein S18 acetylase RimI-like enzyme
MAAVRSERCAVRLATADDLPALTALCHEMEQHYDGHASVGEDVVREALKEQLFGARRGIDVLVAEADGNLLGLATVSMIFPAARFAPALFMKDIFVSAGVRSCGIGTALLRAVARLAVDRGCSRVDWSAARDNVAALAFYRRLGARVSETAVAFRLDGEAMARLAAGSGDG